MGHGRCHRGGERCYRLSQSGLVGGSGGDGKRFVLGVSTAARRENLTGSLTQLSMFFPSRSNVTVCSTILNGL